MGNVFKLKKIKKVDLFPAEKDDKEEEHEEEKKKLRSWGGVCATAIFVSLFVAWTLYCIITLSPHTPNYSYSEVARTADIIVELNSTNFAIAIKSADLHDAFYEVNVFFYVSYVPDPIQVPFLLMAPQPDIFDGAYTLYAPLKSIQVDTTQLDQTANGATVFSLVALPLNCGLSWFEMHLFFATSYNVDLVTGKISNQGDSYAHSYWQNPTTNMQKYQVELTPQTYSVQPTTIFGKAQTTSRYSADPTIAFAESSVCTAGNNGFLDDSSSYFRADFSIGDIVDVTSVSYPSYWALASSLGGLWSSIFGLIGLVFWGYWWLYKEWKGDGNKDEGKKKYDGEENSNLKTGSPTKKGSDVTQTFPVSP